MNSDLKNKKCDNSKPFLDLWKLAKEYSITDFEKANAKYTCTSPSNLYTDVIDSDMYKYYNTQLPSPVPSSVLTKSQLDLSNHIRMLWEQHIIWTVFTIISLIENEPYKDIVIKRLLRNPVDFEAALRPLYGNEIAKKFSDLLTSHLVIASDLVKAAIAGDTKAADAVEKKWYANADEIADFLGSINPYWSKEEWRKMLYSHLALTKAEAVYRLNKDYEKGIAIYDDIEKQALEMADMMTFGILRQFPDLFRI